MSDDRPVAESLSEIEALLGGQAKLFRLPEHVDPRGSLRPLEFGGQPFRPERLFVVRDVPTGTSRGGHAHATCRQLLIALAGEIMVELRHAQEEAKVLLSAGERALLIEPPVWSRQTYVGPGAILLVLASEPYDEDSYLLG